MREEDYLNLIGDVVAVTGVLSRSPCQVHTHRLTAADHDTERYLGDRPRPRGSHLTQITHSALQKRERTSSQ